MDNDLFEQLIDMLGKLDASRFYALDRTRFACPGVRFFSLLPFMGELMLDGVAFPLPFKQSVELRRLRRELRKRLGDQHKRECWQRGMDMLKRSI